MKIFVGPGTIELRGAGFTLNILLLDLVQSLQCQIKLKLVFLEDGFLVAL